ncbi:MAG: hypothetical protein AAFX06_29185 [Planctomycetota bacterium]
MPMPETVADDAGFNLAPGETLVPGSVQTLGPAAGGDAVAAEEAAPEAEVPVSASDDAGEDAPPAPTPDADTDI